MGLDILIYSRNTEKTNSIELSERLHNAIFDTGYYGTCKYLRQLDDYYAAYLILKTDSEITGFISDLRYISQFLDDDNNIEINNLLNSLSKKDIYKIRIAGD